MPTVPASFGLGESADEEKFGETDHLGGGWAAPT